MTKHRLLTVLWAAATAGGCTEPIDDEPETTHGEQAAFVTVGNIPQNGTNVVFEDISAPTGIDVTKIVGLTACDPKALYAVEQIGAAFQLWFSNTNGQSWTAQTLAGKSKEIACDHGLLATLDANKDLWIAKTNLDGSLRGWYATANIVKVDRIAGGDGSFYGVKAVAGGNDVYIASGKALGGGNCVDDANKNPQSCVMFWGSPVVTIGATQVTGTGLTQTGTDSLPVGNTLAWSRRAFALEANGTVSTNAQLLDGGNSWSPLNTGSERYLTLTAAAPNILFGIQNRSGVIRLSRIRIKETSCSDGADNDANGLVDGEDPECVQPRADTFCQAHVDGDYCADRNQPLVFLDQINQNTALIKCSTGRGGFRFATVTPGVCQRNPAATNADHLLSEEELTPADPPLTGHYCNVHWPDGTWGFDVTGAKPCNTLLLQKPLGIVVRAGLYSLTTTNYVFARCSNGSVGPMAAPGVAPLNSANAAVGHTNNKCIFQVSEAAFPMFDRVWDPAHEIAGRSTNPFIHNQIPVALAQFGFGELGGNGAPPLFGFVDRFGHDKGAREAAYDAPLDEGRPLLAPAGGVVIMNGSRDRDVSPVGAAPGTPNQSELFVRYSIGNDSDYRESFVVYYAHMRKRLVVDGQTVKAGQILGYVGATGSTSGFAHVHIGVLRASNTNAHSVAFPDAGWHVDIQPDLTTNGVNTNSVNAVDPLGWASSAIDPWGYVEFDAGKGAWSPDLFKPGKGFSYP